MALVVVIAVAGPWLAPQDPMARTSVLNIDGKWVGPPFPAFSNGFLLGSDRAGRDIFSRLLWAVRPTLSLVIIIAAVRLLLGLGIGLAAGYGTGWGQRAASVATRLALAVPVLVVALATIAFVGIQRGLLAFLLGLSLTGWAETARYVETQTRVIRQQPFMEAARSMGAPSAHQVIYHILRHLLPLTAMLLAIEISSTLMTTAALGFLGYYIGGGAWLTVEDFVARSTAGIPELGQMLAAAIEQILDPWPMIVVGGFVVVIIFGFSLLGEGLRRRLQGERAGQLSWLHAGLNRVAGWINGGILPAAPAARRRWGLAAGAVLCRRDRRRRRRVLAGAGQCRRPGTQRVQPGAAGRQPVGLAAPRRLRHAADRRRRPRDADRLVVLSTPGRVSPAGLPWAQTAPSTLPVPMVR